MPQKQSLSRFSIGVGDRFAHQARAQLRACVQAAEAGVLVVPVWNKSNREHTIIGSEPAAIQLRYLQTVTEISSENNSTTFFPIPIDLFKGFLEAVSIGQRVEVHTP